MPGSAPGHQPVDVDCLSCGAHKQLPGPIGNIDVPKLRCHVCNRNRKLRVNRHRVWGKYGRLLPRWSLQQPFEPITAAGVPLN